MGQIFHALFLPEHDEDIASVCYEFILYEKE
jgi:hypothetical protein